MSEATDQASTNREAALLATAEAEEARRVVLLWQRPTIPDADIPEALGVPRSVWAALKAEGDSPPIFMLGRRVFCRTADLRTWLDAKAERGRPGSRRLRESGRKAA